MRDAALAGNEAKLDVRAFVGGVDISVPEGWDVQANVSTTIGGVNDERRHRGSHAGGAPLLEITGTATMGGVNIRD